MSRGARGWTLVVVQVILLVVLILLPWRPPTLWLTVLGAALGVVGVTLLVASFRELGRALTATPVPIRQAGLRTTGPYSLVRHPIYTGLLLGILGLLVAFGSWLSWAWGAVILVFFILKSRWEDRLLHEEYGQEWMAWSSHTGGLIPKLTGRRP